MTVSVPITSRSHGGARRQLEGLAQAHPEWRSWLNLYAQTLHAGEDPVWAEAVPTLAPTRSPVAPLLIGATMPLAPRQADAWVRHLLAAAGREEGPQAADLTAAAASDRLDAVALLEASINQDAPRLAALAVVVRVDPDALGAVAQLAALPLLRASARPLAPLVPPAWNGGCCPVCGAWPAVAESRGLERSHRLRCGRCGSDWGFVALRCPFCGTDEHTQLGSLISETEGEARKVETCGRCRGYIKSVATLRAWTAEEVPLVDLASVDLDLAALDRNFARPTAPAFDLGLRLIDPDAVPAR